MSFFRDEMMQRDRDRRKRGIRKRIVQAPPNPIPATSSDDEPRESNQDSDNGSRKDTTSP